MPARDFYLVDAFTSTPFCGNPCAVLPEADGLDEADMGRIARETNAPETAFVFRPDPARDGEARVRVRYFMPRGEIPFAGHPTIATACLLRQLGVLRAGTRVPFAFNIGVLPVEILEHEAVMSQPVPVLERQLDRGALLAALGLGPEAGLGGLAPWLVRGGVPFVVMGLADLPSLHTLRMNREALARILAEAGVSAVYAFAPGGANPEARFQARLLDPANAGEDPYTGSAAGCLAAYAQAFGLLDGPEFLLEQGQCLQRPGEGRLRLHLEGDRILGLTLAGNAVTTAEGRLNW